MILRPYHSPQPLIEAASAAAYELRDAAREMTLKDLERFICPSSEASVRVLAHVQFTKDDAYEAASFEISAEPAVIPEDSFCCAVPVMQGYWQAAHLLAEAAEDFWLAREVDRRLATFGRELARVTDEKLEEMATYRHRLNAHSDSKDLNDVMLIEMARREKEARRNESNHARLLAGDGLDAAELFLEEEARQAILWWEGLTESDQKYLPDYDCRELEYEARAIFTYRDFLEKRRNCLKRNNIKLDFSTSMISKKQGFALHPKVAAE